MGAWPAAKSIAVDPSQRQGVTFVARTATGGRYAARTLRRCRTAGRRDRAPVSLLAFYLILGAGGFIITRNCILSIVATMAAASASASWINSGP